MDKEAINKKQVEELEKLNATKDKFFSIIAHDLRGPLTTTIRMLEMGSRHPNELRQKELIPRLGKELEKVNLLLDNLLWWARSQRNEIRMVEQEVDVFMLTEEIISLWKESATSKKIVLSNRVQDGLVWNTDEYMLSTIIRNLISNAVKFTQPGGEIRIFSRQINRYLYLGVEDTGIGMSREVLKILKDHSFSPGSRGTAGEAGSGLGLMLCNEFLARMRGRMHIESFEGKGSRFLIEFYPAGEIAAAGDFTMPMISSEPS